MGVWSNGVAIPFPQPRVRMPFPIAKGKMEVTGVSSVHCGDQCKKRKCARSVGERSECRHGPFRLAFRGEGSASACHMDSWRMSETGPMFVIHSS